MGIGAVGAAAAAIATANAILRGAQREAFDTGPDYMRDGTPDGVVGRIGLGIARQACRRYADDPGKLDDPEATSFETVCRPYLDNIGYGVGPGIAKPFEGGQCNAVYIGEVRGVDTRNNAPISQKFKTWGPISGARSGTNAAGVPAFFVTSSGEVLASALCSGGDPAQGPLQERQFGGTRAPWLQINGMVIVEACAGSDECGNPPPEIIDPEPPPTPGPPTEPFNPGPDIDIDITVDVRPDALVEVNLGFGPVVIAPFSGGEGEEGEPQEPSPPSPEPGPTLPGGNGGFGGDDQFGDPPAGRRWVGCCITLTNRPINQPPIPNTVPEDVYPAVVGNIRLVCNAAGNRVVDTPVRIQAKRVCVWEPVARLNPTAVNVDLLPGFGYTYTPYSVPLELPCKRATVEPEA